MDVYWAGLGVLATLSPAIKRRIELSRAKHRSLAGHSRMAKRLARWMPGYSLDEDRFFDCDGAPADVAARRKAAFFELAKNLQMRHELSLRTTQQAREHISDLQFTGRVAYQEQVFSGKFVYAPAGSLSLVDTTGGWLSAESRFVYSGFTSHKLVFGADAQRDMQLSIKNVDNASGSTVLDAHDKTWRVGVFVQDEWSIAPRWRLSAGARYDRYSIDLAHTSPRLGLVHTLTDATTVKLLAGQAYRVPNAFERQYEDGYYLANSSLKPEIIQTYEGIVEQRIAHDQLLGASLYTYNFHDQIDQTFVNNDTQLRYENKERTTVRGAEMFWRAPRIGQGSLFASVGINHASSASSSIVPNSPAWLTKLRATHPLGHPQWQGAMEWQAIGPRDVESGSTTYKLSRQWWMNAVVNSTAFGRGTHLQLRVVNVFDRVVSIPVAEAAATLMPMSRRTLQVMLSHDF